jgi:hypothetical protein
MRHAGGLLRRASMVVQSEANSLEARFWIAVVPGGKGARFCRLRSDAFKSEHPPVLYRARLFLPDE